VSCGSGRGHDSVVGSPNWLELSDALSDTVICENSNPGMESDIEDKMLRLTPREQIKVFIFRYTQLLSPNETAHFSKGEFYLNSRLWGSDSRTS